jgi:ATP-binding cassette subfamily D (ALD) protein 2
MVVMAIPIFTGNDAGKSAGDSVADRTEYYTTAKNLLTSGADAMERLMTAYKVKLEIPKIRLLKNYIIDHTEWG